MEIVLLFVSGILTLGGVFLIAYAKKRIEKAQFLIKEAQAKWENSKKEIESEKRDARNKLQDELYRKKNEFEFDLKRERIELEKLQVKNASRYEALEKKEQHVEELKRELQNNERSLSRLSDQIRTQEARVKQQQEQVSQQLENLSSMTKEEARIALTKSIEAEVLHANQKWIQKAEEEARYDAKGRAVQIIVTAMQRYSADSVAEHSAGVVHLPNDEMKGRIIGKEGRNIKALEMATGMEFVIGDTPEVITISGFNPIRREVARRSLEKLIADGRINPTRIEETVHQCEREIEEMIQEFGKEAMLEFNLQGMKPELISLLGKLHFRTSFSQNVLVHSKEVALFSRMIAQELGLNGDIALRAGLLHDIGKSVSAEIEGPHALIGGDIAKRCGEDPLVVNAIAAHHEEVPFISIYSPIIMIADTLSASRPGARRETLSTYVKRLEKLEELAMHYSGIKKAFALQAGREIRVIVEEDVVDDEKALFLARDLARKIELEMTFPGQIKINVIREKRAIEYAR
jgi:ribonuclease Y